MRQKSPISLIFTRPTGKDAVSVVNVISTEAVVHRWTDGPYFIYMGRFKFPVKLNKASNGFELRISMSVWSAYFAPTKEVLHHVANRDPKAA